MATWYTGDATGQQALLAVWSDAPVASVELCSMVMDTARDQVLAYAPAPPEGEDWQTAPPARLVYAQLQQAKDLWNAGRVGPAGDVGPDGFSFRPARMTSIIKNIIRPIDGTPHVL